MDRDSVFEHCPHAHLRYRQLKGLIKRQILFLIKLTSAVCTDVKMFDCSSTFPLSFGVISEHFPGKYCADAQQEMNEFPFPSPTYVVQWATAGTPAACPPGATSPAAPRSSRATTPSATA